MSPYTFEGFFKLLFHAKLKIYKRVRETQNTNLSQKHFS